MTSSHRIYLDNAATSWPKPEAVYKAVDHYMRDLGAPAGRSVYQEAAEVERLILHARQSVARLMRVEEARRVIFTLNGTDSLNLALHGLLQQGDHVVTTVCEHNSVLRPLRQLEEAHVIEVTRVACDAAGIIDPASIAKSIKQRTRLIAVTHASNVTGALQPVESIGRIVAEHEKLFLVDAAQTLGHVPLSPGEIGAHLLAAPGHKGLMGPLGTGILYVSEEAERELSPTRQGGTGTTSETDLQPSTLPEKLESGSLNVPGIVGLGAAADHLLQLPKAATAEHDVPLTQQLLDGLAAIERVTVYGPRDADRQVGVVSISLPGYDPQEAATVLDSAYALQARAGLHCAPRMHGALGTLDSGGTLRLSLGFFNSAQQIDQALQAIDELAASSI